MQGDSKNSSYNNSQSRTGQKHKRKFQKDLHSKMNKSRKGWESRDGKKGLRFLRIDEANKIYSGYQNEPFRTSSEFRRKKHGNFELKKPKEKKMVYFMETLEIKNQISQLELENRRLQINYSKLRKMNLEKFAIIKRSEDYAMIGGDPEVEEEKYFKKASSILKLKMQINEVNWKIDQRNREIKRLKLIKRELSEREFIDRIEASSVQSRKYRNQAFRLMKKYKGVNENEGINEETMNKYQYQNMVLEEYEEMLREVDHNKELLIKAKFRRKGDIEYKNQRLRVQKEAKENIRDRIELLNRRMEELEDKKKERAKYDRDHFKEIEREKMNLDEKLKQINQKKKDLDQEFTNLQGTLKETLDNAQQEKKKKFDELEALENLNKPEEENESGDEEEPGIIQEDRSESQGPIEKMRRVNFEDVERYGNYLKYSFSYRGLDQMEAYRTLIRNDDPLSDDSIPLNVVESNLRKSPIHLKSKEQARLLARYLIEDNTENYIYFDPKVRNLKIIVKSIWKTMLGKKIDFSLEKMNQLHDELIEIFHSSKYNIQIETKRIQSPKYLTDIKFFEMMKVCGVEFETKQRQYLLLHLCGISLSINHLRYKEIFEIFTEKGKEIYFDKLGAGEDLQKMRAEKRRKKEDEERELMNSMSGVSLAKKDSHRNDYGRNQPVNNNLHQDNQGGFHDSIEDQPSSYHSNSRMGGEQKEDTTVQKDTDNSKDQGKDGLNLNFFGGNESPKKDPFANADEGFEEEPQEDEFDNGSQKYSVKDDKSDFSYGHDPLKDQGFGNHQFENEVKPADNEDNDEDSFLNYNDAEVDHLEHQIEGDDRKSQGKKPRHVKGKESLEMVENKFKFRIDGESSERSNFRNNMGSEVNSDDKKEKEGGWAININRVNKFNDRETEKKIQNQNKFSRTVTDPKENKIVFQSGGDDLKRENSEEIVDRKELEKSAPQINFGTITTFNDPTQKKKIEEQHKQTTEYVDDSGPSKFVKKQSTLVDPKIKRAKEVEQFSINLSGVDTFNDPTNEKLLLKQYKETIKLEDMLKEDEKAKITFKQEAEEAPKPKPKRPEMPQISFNRVDNFNDEAAKKKIEENEKIKIAYKEDEPKLVFQGGENKSAEEDFGGFDSDSSSLDDNKLGDEGDSQKGDPSKEKGDFDLKGYRPFTLNKQKTPKTSTFGLRDSRGRVIDGSFTLKKGENLATDSVDKEEEYDGEF